MPYPSPPNFRFEFAKNNMMLLETPIDSICEFGHYLRHSHTVRPTTGQPQDAESIKCRALWHVWEYWRHSQTNPATFAHQPGDIRKPASRPLDNCKNNCKVLWIQCRAHYGRPILLPLPCPKLPRQGHVGSFEFPKECGAMRTDAEGFGEEGNLESRGTKE